MSIHTSLSCYLMSVMILNMFVLRKNRLVFIFSTILSNFSTSGAVSAKKAETNSLWVINYCP